MIKYGAKEKATGPYSEDGNCLLQIVGFPCNQFGYQEPAENFELMNCLKYVRPGYGYEPNFPVLGKTEVNGHSESPIFTFLKSRCPPPMGLIANRTDITWTPIRSNDISWNFSKWLLDHKGNPFRRYTPRTPPFAIEEDIQQMLAKCKAEYQGKNSTETGNASAPAAPVSASVVNQPQNPQAVPAQVGRKKRSFLRVYD